MRVLTAIPVYNEEAHLEAVLAEVLRYAGDVLVVDDGSTDRTPELLRTFPDGPGDPPRAEPGLRRRASGARSTGRSRRGYDGLVTLDCDGQHEPSLIPTIAARLDEADIVSGSRYLKVFDPAQRPARGAAEDQRRGHALAQRVPGPEPDRRLLRLQGVPRLGPREVRDHRRRLRHAACRSGSRRSQHGLSIVEVPVPLIYLDESRAFGGALDDAAYRLNHYRRVFQRRAGAGGAGSGGGVSLMKPHRLRAPSADGALLAEPPLDRGRRACSPRTPTALAAGITTSRGGAPAGSARMARRQVARPGPALPRSRSASTCPDLPDARPRRWSSRVISPSCSIPASGSRTSPPPRSPDRRAGVGLNLIVDNDIPKSADRSASPHRWTARLRRPSGSSSTSGRARSRTRTWRSATRRSSPRSPTGSARSSAARSPIPIVDEFWPRVLGVPRAGPTGSASGSRWPGERWRRRGGSATSRSRSSAVCETEAFLWFAVAPPGPPAAVPGRSTTTALARYRALYGIRSKHHPVPALGRAGRVARGPVLGLAGRASRGGGRCWSGSSRATMELRIGGEDEPFLEIPLGRRPRGLLRRRATPEPAGAGRPAPDPGPDDHDVRPLPAGRPLRPRDRRREVRRAGRRDRPAASSGSSRPTYLTLSMTLWLGLRDRPGHARTGSSGSRAAAPRPDLQPRPAPGRPPTDPEPARLVEAKRQAIAGPVETRRAAARPVPRDPALRTRRSRSGSRPAAWRPGRSRHRLARGRPAQRAGAEPRVRLRPPFPRAGSARRWPVVAGASVPAAMSPADVASRNNRSVAEKSPIA